MLAYWLVVKGNPGLFIDGLSGYVEVEGHL